MIRDAETLNQLIDTISRFVRERLVPAEEQVAQEDRIPDDILSEMKEMGLFGLSIPEEYGGLGLTMEEEALVALRDRQDLPGLPLHLRHQQRHRRPGHPDRRHRGTEAALHPAPGHRRADQLVLPDRARCRLRRRQWSAPPR